MSRHLSRLEHWLSLFGGGALIIYGLARRSFVGLLLAILGGDLVFRELANEEPHIHEVYGFEL